MDPASYDAQLRQAAFNQVNRSAFVQATCKEFPGLANWTNWCYGEESTLLYDHREVITSSSGVQQGDPLSPLYLCFALNELVREIASLGPVPEMVHGRWGNRGTSPHPPSGLGASSRQRPFAWIVSQPQEVRMVLAES